MTTWKPVVGYENEYEVSDDGKVRSVDRYVLTSNGQTRFYRSRVLAGSLTSAGYPSVALCRGKSKKDQPTFLVHRLVLDAFVGPASFSNPVVRHLNDIKTDNRLENLAWGTQVENKQDAIRNGRHAWGTLIVERQLACLVEDAT